MLKHLATAFALSALLIACASEPKPRLSAENPLLEPVSDFLAEQDYLRGKLEQGNPRKFDEEEWERFEQIQRNFQLLLADADHVDALSEDEKARLYANRVGLVNLLLGGGELMCVSRPPPTGTRMGGRTRHCVSRSRLEHERFTARTWREFFEAEPRTIDWDSGGSADPWARGTD